MTAFIALDASVLTDLPDPAPTPYSKSFGVGSIATQSSKTAKTGATSVRMVSAKSKCGPAPLHFLRTEVGRLEIQANERVYLLAVSRGGPEDDDKAGGPHLLPGNESFNLGCPTSRRFCEMWDPATKTKHD